MSHDPHASAELLREAQTTIDHLKGQLATLTDEYMEIHEQLLRERANVAILIGLPLPRLEGDYDHLDPTQIPSHETCAHAMMELEKRMGAIIRNEMKDWVAGFTLLYPSLDLDLLLDRLHPEQ